MKICPVCGDYTLSKDQIKKMSYSKAIECSHCKSQISKSYYSIFLSGIFTITMQLLLKYKINLITLSLILVFASLLIWFLDRYVPYIQVINLKKQKIIHVVHVLLIIGLSILIISSRFNFIERTYIADDFREVQEVLYDLENDLELYQKGELSDKDLRLKIDHAYIDCIIAGASNINSRSLTEYFGEDPFQVLNSLAYIYSIEAFTEEELVRLKAFIDIHRSYSELGEVSHYKLSLNIFKKLQPTDLVKAYLLEIKNL